ncbi:MAG: hypothetical protein Q9195_002527 [Heterodermia aff. obscurata]
MSDSNILQDAFIYGVIVPVLPFSLRTRSGIDEKDIQQRVSELLAIFGLAECLGAPFFGWLADRTSSRRAPFLFGFILNAGATALLCFATNIHLLLLSRALQGFSAAIVYTVGFALLADTVGSKNMGEWMGYNIMSVNIGITASPTVGGVLYDHAGYYSIFILIAVLIGVDILLRIVLVEKRTAAEWMEEDIQTGENAPTQYGTFGAVSPGPSQQKDPSDHSVDGPSSERQERSSPTRSNTSSGNSAPTMSESMEPSFAGPSQQKDPSAHSVDATSSKWPDNFSSTKSYASVEHHDLRDDITGRSESYPALFTLLASPRILADLYAIFVNVSLLVSYDSALPIFVERTFGWTSTGAGLIFITLTLPILGAPLSGKLTDRYQSRWIPVTGFLIVAVLTALVQLVRHHSASQVALLISLLTLTGCVRVVASSPLGADLYRAVMEMEEERPGLFGKSGAYAQVFALYTAASAAGVLVGPLWTSFAYGDHNWTVLMSTLAGFCASVALPLMLSNTTSKNGKERSPSPSAA